MTASGGPSANVRVPVPEALGELLAETRQRTLGLVASIADADLDRVHSPLMSPLAWDLGHIAAFEDLWLVHRHVGVPLLRPDLAEVYDAFETPRSRRGGAAFLRADTVRAYLAAVRKRALEALARHGSSDGLVPELVIRHEQQHNETMLQSIVLARFDGYRAPARRATPAPSAEHTGLELVSVPAGPFELGAPAAGFAYDNERPRHRAALPAFRIGRTPVTNAAFADFVVGGGYRRREWWSRQGWLWKEREGVECPGGWDAAGREWRATGWEPLDPAKPVTHVSFFEAEAFARAHAARLPTEAEWEKAALWDPTSGKTRRYPWGDDPPGPARANVDQLAFGPAAAGAYPAGASPCGCLGMVGDVWEWTASDFCGYPGFIAHPYREYSQVFFGQGFKVLRGGSWATRPAIATPSFRNWDHPQRRQIFAGVRVAKDGR